jgi:hypothetical protein
MLRINMEMGGRFQEWRVVYLIRFIIEERFMCETITVSYK